MSPHECNKKITVYFHAKKKAEDEQKQMYDENKKMEWIILLQSIFSTNLIFPPYSVFVLLD